MTIILNDFMEFLLVAVLYLWFSLKKINKVKQVPHQFPCAYFVQLNSTRFPREFPSKFVKHGTKKNIKSPNYTCQSTNENDVPRTHIQIDTQHISFNDLQQRYMTPVNLHLTDNRS